MPNNKNDGIIPTIADLTYADMKIKPEVPAAVFGDVGVPEPSNEDEEEADVV